MGCNASKAPVKPDNPHQWRPPISGPQKAHRISLTPEDREALEVDLLQSMGELGELSQIAARVTCRAIEDYKIIRQVHSDASGSGGDAVSQGLLRIIELQRSMNTIAYPAVLYTF